MGAIILCFFLRLFGSTNLQVDPSGAQFRHGIRSWASHLIFRIRHEMHARVLRSFLTFCGLSPICGVVGGGAIKSSIPQGKVKLGEMGKKGGEKGFGSDGNDHQQATGVCS